MENSIKLLNFKSKKVLLALDYDGTLTEIVNNPLEAKLTEQRKNLLKNLSNNNNIRLVINSGRPIEELLIITDNINIDMLGNHGLFYYDRNSKEKFTLVEYKKLKDWDKIMINVREYLKSDFIPNYTDVWIQEDEHGFVIHTRLMDRSIKENFIHQLKVIFENKFPNIKYSFGKEIIEVKPDFITNKAIGLQWYIKINNITDSTIITVGDDTTDEDMFLYTNSLQNGISIKIGDSKKFNSPSYAKYRIDSVNDFYSFLENKFINKKGERFIKF